MNCNRCGAINQIGKYCSSCGSEIIMPKIGSITIVRKKQFGGMFPFDVKVDNIFIGQVNNGETKTFPLYYGEHLLRVECGFDSGTIALLLNDNQKNITYNCYSKAGINPDKRVQIDVIGFSK